MPRPEAFRKAFGLLAGKRLAGAAIEEVLLGHETVKQNRRVPRRRAAVYGTPTLPRRAVTPSRITSMRLALQRRAAPKLLHRAVNSSRATSMRLALHRRADATGALTRAPPPPPRIVPQRLRLPARDDADAAVDAQRGRLQARHRAPLQGGADRVQ